MKQKFSILFDESKEKLIIREYAELDKEIMSLLCEETYDKEAIGAAIELGKKDLVSTLRTKNLYPPGMFAERIADAVTELFQSGSGEILELRFDDLELMASEEEEEVEENLEDEAEDIDELLEDNVEDEVGDDFDNNIEMKNIKSPLKVADDDSPVIDEES